MIKVKQKEKKRKGKKRIETKNKTQIIVMILRPESLRNPKFFQNVLKKTYIQCVVDNSGMLITINFLDF